MVSINISDMVAGEQNNSAYMVVQLSAPSANTVSVNYATNNDTAHSGSDYVSTSGTLNFSPGETTKVVRVELVDDNITEDYQRFSFNLSNPTNATIPKSTAWIGIIDDESAPGLILFSPADEAAGVAVSSNTEITFSEAIQWPRHISIYGIPPSGQGATVLNTTGVPVNSNIEITFTEEIQLGVGGIVLKDFGGTIIETFDAASSSQLMISGKTLTIDPTADLASNTGYSVKFENGSIQDLAGNSYTGMTGYNFLTADIIAPTVISFNPADEAIGVAADSNIVLTFSEVIQRGTGSIVLKTADGTTVETFDAATSGHLLISDSTLIIDLTNNLADGTNYFVALDPGTIKDLAGNAYVGTNTYDFTTATFTGTAGNDTISGGAFNDIINGGAGIDTVTFSGNFSDYQITKTGPGYTLTSASGDTDILTNVEHLQFADRSVNLTIQNTAMGIDSAAVQRIEELYVAFFNRVPDADGLEAWMIAFKNGASINSIAEDFYDAGISYSALTGYSAGMSNEDFVNTIYRNVLGRVDGADPLGLASWSGELASGRETHGSLVSSILESAHTFKGDEEWGWVADLLDNKIQVADTFAVDWGMGYNTQEDSITNGMTIAAAVTPTDTSAAISLIGIQGGHINLGIQGTTGNDMIYGGLYNDIIDGGAGIDTLISSGNLADCMITKTSTGYTLTSDSSGTDILTNVERLQFADMSVNLTIQDTAAGIDSAVVQRIEELYLAFFNRVPDADGLESWMIAFKNGFSINSIAEDFYSAGIAYGALTGYSAGMSNEDFVNTIYRNVLGRPDGADPLGLASWSGELASGRETHGSLVSSILESAHTFKGDTTWGWVADLLDNKIQVADTFAVDWGMGYNTPADSISHGMAIAGAVTPLDTAAAISLIGVQVGHINLG